MEQQQPLIGRKKGGQVGVNFSGVLEKKLEESKGKFHGQKRRQKSARVVDQLKT